MSVIKTPLKVSDEVQAFSVIGGWEDAEVVEIIDAHYVFCLVGGKRRKYSVTNINKNY